MKDGVDVSLKRLIINVAFGSYLSFELMVIAFISVIYDSRVFGSLVRGNRNYYGDSYGKHMLRAYRSVPDTVRLP